LFKIPSLRKKTLLLMESMDTSQHLQINVGVLKTLYITYPVLQHNLNSVCNLS